MSKFMQNIRPKMLNFRFDCQFVLLFFAFVKEKKNKRETKCQQKYISYIYIHAFRKGNNARFKANRHTQNTHTHRQRRQQRTTTTETMQSVNFLIYLISFDNLYSFRFSVIRNIVCLAGFWGYRVHSIDFHLYFFLMFRLRASSTCRNCLWYAFLIGIQTFTL